MLWKDLRKACPHSVVDLGVGENHTVTHDRKRVKIQGALSGLQDLSIFRVSFLFKEATTGLQTTHRGAAYARKTTPLSKGPAVSDAR